MATRLTSLVLVASMLGLNAAQAASNFAEINLMQGKVLVNQGEGFVALAEGSALKAGDKVLVGKDSSVIIAYKGGCAVSINESKVVTVAKAAPCKAGTTATIVGSNLISPVADPAAGGAPVGLGAGVLPLILLGGGAAVVGAVVLFGTPNNGKPVSGGAG
jgi:hypothetical protein